MGLQSILAPYESNYPGWYYLFGGQRRIRTFETEVPDLQSGRFNHLHIYPMFFTSTSSDLLSGPRSFA